MLIEIAVSVIALCCIILTTGVISVAIKARATLNEAHKLIEQVRFQTAPLVHDATQIAGDIRSIVKTLEREMPKVGDSLDALKGTAMDIREFETMLRERVERPLLDLTSIIAGLSKGLVIFWRTLVHRR
ncbi:MAG: DUF948 domain-containing protein [Deferribacteres bacterium]|nr:DUF948 domain-containing protein [candidate division KSB1 bacterium]MCB9512291.1 DUF948 domain-containing protein [Deferribacteres bacterium]